jgi:hypothetical protein
VTGGAAVNVTSTSNSSAHGIEAYSKTGSTSINFTGNVNSVSGRGISALVKDSAGSIVTAMSGGFTVTVTSGGIVTSRAVGLYGRANGAGQAVSITANGNVTSSNSQGISAISQSSDVMVTAIGKITGGTTGADSRGIGARSYGSGTVTVNNKDVTASSNIGVLAVSKSGAVTVTSEGAVASKFTGVYAGVAAGSGAVIVNAKSGSVTSDGVAGGEIYATKFARGQGIFAGTLGSGNVTVTGGAAVNVTSTSNSQSHGIEAYSKSGNATVDFTGDVT